jgi:hypothetical protein
MDMSNIMIVSALQAKDIDHYKIIKEKLYKTNNILNNSAFVGFIVLMNNINIRKYSMIAAYWTWSLSRFIFQRNVKLSHRHHYTY